MLLIDEDLINNALPMRLEPPCGTGSEMTNGEEFERERRLTKLAEMLSFKLEKHEDGFTLTRTADVSEPVRHLGLTADEVEKILNTWKLRGPHGG